MYGGTLTLTTSPVTGNTAHIKCGGGIRMWAYGEAHCIGAHFEGNSAPDGAGSDVCLSDSYSNFTASPCPDGYDSTVDGTLDVYGGSGTYDSYTCTAAPNDETEN